MMNVTDHTLGVIFGIIRGVVVMGIVYWIALWYFSDTPRMPHWLEGARTRPIMQMTAVKLDEWFVPGAENKLLKRDVAGTRESQKIYDNLINPRVVDKEDKNAKPLDKPNDETGYKNSERNALENQLLQIETVANAVERHEQRREQQEQK
jgi:membrane protein required for colicin V production